MGGTANLKTLHAAGYHAPDAYTVERQMIFAREWLLLGHARELQSPGDYLAEAIAGWPVLVIRDKAGALKGFHNVCRHRAGPLVEDGCGHTAALRCRYHGWLYDTDGRLARRPDFSAGADAFDGRELALKPIAVAEWRGFVFVNLDVDAGPLTDGLGDLVTTTRDFPIERYSFYRRQTYDLSVNWKTYVDNYLEGYHIPLMHKGLARDLDMASYRVENADRVSIHRSSMRSEAAYQGLFLWRWPNNTIGVYGGGFNICRILPEGVRRTRLTFDFYFDPQAGLDADAKERAASTTCGIVEEDFPMCEVVQRNLEAGSYDCGPLSPKHEQGVAYFHDLVRHATGGRVT
ncbi:MAG: aromatic ring-hydroxylating dioxygenase subunit alpha [Hyphomicrobiaceae bacterium]